MSAGALGATHAGWITLIVSDLRLVNDILNISIRKPHWGMQEDQWQLDDDESEQPCPSGVGHWLSPAQAAKGNCSDVVYNADNSDSGGNNGQGNDGGGNNGEADRDGDKNNSDDGDGDVGRDRSWDGGLGGDRVGNGIIKALLFGRGGPSGVRCLT
ncbi:hypothetical protein HOY80DRAFT_1030974 [Tuber brumale]|nr:hypothetical protein HOY80DRAFT_1030974 [Tuber brumale]